MRDQIANIMWIWERAHEYNQGLYLYFIDYSKAFDCVDQNTLGATLTTVGMLSI